MSLWGNKDTVYATGNVTTITAGGVVTGSGTTFSASKACCCRSGDHHGCIWFWSYQVG